MTEATENTTQPTIDEIIAASSATPEFLAAVGALRASRLGELGDRIRFNRVSPPVKVLRTVVHMLHAHPDWAVESVDLEGFSGCSDFVGTATVATASGAQKVSFAWDCAWKADEMSWRDAYGFPDQIRAAQTFDWNCFKSWQVATA